MLRIVWRYCSPSGVTVSVGESAHPANIHSLYQDHHRWLRGLLYRRLGNAEDAADLAHDAFVRLIIKPRRLDNTGSARAYLSAVARGLCIDLWRRREVEQAWLETLASQPEMEVPSAEQQAAAIEALLAVDAMLRRLPPDVASAFIKSMIHGLSSSEIARELGVTERTVRNYLSRAMLECLLLQSRMNDDARPGEHP